jgi:hypothetical protein
MDAVYGYYTKQECKDRNDVLNNPLLADMEHFGTMIRSAQLQSSTQTQIVFNKETTKAVEDYLKKDFDVDSDSLPNQREFIRSVSWNL